MRNLWIDSGNDPDLTKRIGTTGLYFDMFDPRVTQQYLVKYQNLGFVVGVYMARNWAQFSGLTEEQAAEKVVARVKQIGGSLFAKSFPKVQIDDERHEPAHIRAFFKRYRELLPHQDTSWTLEGGQAGWMSPAFVGDMIQRKVRIVPQCYNGAMTQVWDTWAYCKELMDIGFPRSIISPFYDAAHLPVGWNGFAFTQGRLP